MLGSRGVAGRARSARERVTRRGSRVVIIASGERAKLRRATSAPDEPCALQPDGGLLVVPVFPDSKFSVPLSLVTTFFLATALRMLSTVSLRTLLLVVRLLSSTPEPKLLVWL